jgi:hypothetical protein
MIEMRTDASLDKDVSYSLFIHKDE